MDKAIHAIWLTPAGATKHRFVNDMSELPQEYRDSPFQQATLRYMVTSAAIHKALDEQRRMIVDDVYEAPQPSWEENVRKWLSMDTIRKTVK